VPDLETIGARFARGELSAPVALMQMLLAAADLEIVRAAAPEALRRLLDANRAGCARICAMLRSGVDAPDADETVEGTLAFARKLFDWSVVQSEEASVALYSLGDAGLLNDATAEVVALLERWDLLAPQVRCLQIGCGIGRFEEALAPRVAEARGVDISPNMIAAARRRCAALPNAVFDVTEGRDLSAYAAARFELIYAVDSFPYLVQPGLALVDRHFAEAARVLAPGGHFVLLNFSYRDDLEKDRRDIRALAARHGFTVEIDGEPLLTLWDAPAWKLR
jgi:SAM-dependent methyltransferase